MLEYLENPQVVRSSAAAIDSVERWFRGGCGLATSAFLNEYHKVEIRCRHPHRGLTLWESGLIRPVKEQAEFRSDQAV